MIKVVHIITGLNTGGAEMMLYKLIRYSSKEDFKHEVISLTDVGSVGDKIKELGISVRALNMKGIYFPVSVLRLALWLRKSNPDIIQTWMYHADLMGGLAAKLEFLRAPVIWGIRQTNLDSKLSKQRTRFVAWASALLSRWIPTKILCNSNSGRETHIKMGYDSKKMLVIPNGFDISKFKPDKEARISVRKELGVPEDAFLVGYVARFDPQKDHRTFVRAAELLNKSFPNIHFVLCGRGVTWENKELASWIDEAGLKDRFHLLGERHDTPRINAALDIATITSAYGEGFPNVVGEAMACGVPCVATDVGDSAYIVGSTGIAVEPASAEKVAEGWLKILKLSPKERFVLGERARDRIEAEFSIDNTVERYYNLYQQLCSPK